MLTMLGMACDFGSDRTPAGGECLADRQCVSGLSCVNRICTAPAQPPDPILPSAPDAGGAPPDAGPPDGGSGPGPGPYPGDAGPGDAGIDEGPPPGSCGEALACEDACDQSSASCIIDCTDPGSSSVDQTARDLLNARQACLVSNCISPFDPAWATCVPEARLGACAAEYDACEWDRRARPIPPPCGEGCASEEVCFMGGCCAPTCTGLECGSDGCGGVCGTCTAGVPCVAGACCAPMCDGKTCGDDGCGGSCGGCLNGEVCLSDGQCGVGKTCSEVLACEDACGADVGCIVACGESMDPGSQVLLNTRQACLVAQCVSPFDPGWSECVPVARAGACADAYAACGADRPAGCSDCAAQEVCYQDSCCTPDCDGKSCGGDGCGGSCGDCSYPTGCDDSQQCSYPERSGPRCSEVAACEDACGSGDLLCVLACQRQVEGVETDVVTRWLNESRWACLVSECEAAGDTADCLSDARGGSGACAAEEQACQEDVYVPSCGDVILCEDACADVVACIIGCNTGLTDEIQALVDLREACAEDACGPPASFDPVTLMFVPTPNYEACRAEVRVGACASEYADCENHVPSSESASDSGTGGESDAGVGDAGTGGAP